MPFPMNDRSPNQQANDPFENLQRWGQIITLLLVFGTLVATCQQNGVMKQTLVLSERPWVAVDITAAEPLVFNENGAETLVRFTLTNLGHSPAQYVNLYFAAPPIFDMGEAHTKQREMCNRLRQSNSIDLKDTIYIHKAEVERGTQQLPGRSTIILAVVGCVDYQFTFVEGHHQTGFAFIIVRHDPKKPNSGFAIEIDKGPFPVEHVGFSHMGGMYAD